MSKDNKNKTKRAYNRKHGGSRNSDAKYGSENNKGDGNNTKCNKADNDISWYSKYPNLVLPSSNPYFNKRYGAQIQTIENMDAANAAILNRYTSVPGIVHYVYRPWIVGDGQEESAFNVAAKNFYTFVRHANSGATNYETSDLMQYMYTVSGIMVCFEECKRILRLVPSFNAVNEYIFKTALHALGLSTSNIADIRNNLANYVDRLNVLAAQINTFKIPGDISYVDRWLWLSSNVFRDDDLDKATHYLFSCDTYPHYDWANATIEVKEFAIPNGGKFSDLLSLLENEVNNLLAYEDIGIMIGDILKAYGADKCRVVSPMAVGEILESSYSAEALTQFRNATLHGGNFFTSKITQVASNTQLLQETMDNPDNTVLPDAMIKPGKLFFYSDWYTHVSPAANLEFDYIPTLTVDSNTPSNEEVIIQTRLSNFMHVTRSTLDNHYALIEVTEMGSEVITKAEVIYMFKGTSGNPSERRLTIQSLNYLGTKYDGANDGQLTDGTWPLLELILERTEVFKCTGVANYVLLVYGYNTDSAAGYLHEFNYFDGKNVIEIGRQWLHDLNIGCKMSQMTIPMIKLLESK